MCAREAFQLVTHPEQVNCPYDQIAVLQLISRCFPLVAYLNYPGIWLQPPYHPSRNLSLPDLAPRVLQCPSNKPPRVRDVDSVRVRDHEPTDTNVRTLLNDVRTSAPETNHTQRGILQHFLTTLAEKTLPS